jgi:DNA invertase Pin-like site-specific DNA recombinase
MNMGYARVSTLEQNLDLQMQALKKPDCKRIFSGEGLWRQPGTAGSSAPR